MLRYPDWKHEEPLWPVPTQFIEELNQQRAEYCSKHHTDRETEQSRCLDDVLSSGTRNQSPVTHQHDCRPDCRRHERRNCRSKQPLTRHHAVDLGKAEDRGERLSDIEGPGV